MVTYIALGASAPIDTRPESFREALPEVTVEEREKKIILTYTFHGFHLSDVAQKVNGRMMPFKEVGISGAGFISEPGRPLMPSFGRFVQIPPGCSYKIEVNYSDPVEVKDVMVTPAQESAKDGPQDAVFEYDREAYADEAFFPGKVVEVSEPQNMNDYKALLIHVRPLQYSPSRKLLKGYGTVSIEIEFKPDSEMDEDEQSEFLAVDPSADRGAFGNLVMNPRRTVPGRIGASRVSGPNIPLLRPSEPEFLIIYNESLKKPAAALSEWKQRRGMRTEIISIKEIGNTKENIKAHIRSRRQLPLSRLRYILLFGDTDKIVTDEIGGNTTDYYYFTKTDPSQPHECILPWVSGGRIPVKTEKNGFSAVNQIIRYEKNPPCDPDYYRRMTFAAYFQDDHPQDQRADRAYMKTMESIRAHMIALGMDVDRVYVSNNPNLAQFKDGTPIPQEVKDAIVTAGTATEMLLSDASEGQLIMAHRDHGGDTGWSHPPLNTQQLKSIMSHYPSIFFSINCLTGRFDTQPRDCFAEAVLALDGGAPSLIAATETSGTWRNDSMMKALFDAMWPGMIPTFPGSTASYAVKHHRLGDILNYAKSYLLVAHGNTSGVRDHLEIYHVIGDPTLQLWAEEPLPMHLRANVLREALHVHASACPRGSVMTLWHRNQLIKRMEPTSTRVSIPIREIIASRPSPPIAPNRRKALSICFSAPGHRYAQVNMSI